MATFNLVSDLYLADKFTAAAPTGGVTMGSLYQIGSVFGVAFTTVPDPAVTAEISNDLQNLGSSATVLSYCFVTKGVMVAEKASGAITAGAILYYDSGAVKVTTASTGNTKIGFARLAAGSGDATVEMQFDGTLGVG